jgi:hypothetical protein
MLARLQTRLPLRLPLRLRLRLRRIRSSVRKHARGRPRVTRSFLCGRRHVACSRFKNRARFSCACACLKRAPLTTAHRRQLLSDDDEDDEDYGEDYDSDEELEEEDEGDAAMDALGIKNKRTRYSNAQKLLALQLCTQLGGSIRRTVSVLRQRSGWKQMSRRALQRWVVQACTSTLHLAVQAGALSTSHSKTR